MDDQEIKLRVQVIEILEKREKENDNNPGDMYFQDGYNSAIEDIRKDVNSLRI